MSKVSVIIPCYNLGAYLDEAVDSVLAQTFQDFEIIIVNDGSTDEFTNSLLSSYAKPKTRVIRTTNQGLPAARNSGIREATGDYILPLDADDWIGPDYLAKAVQVLDADGQTGIVYCYGELFGARSGRIPAPAFSLRGMLLSNLIFCSAFFRKGDWERVGGYNPNMRHGFEDWDFWLSILELGRGVHRIPATLFHYRVRDASMVRSMDLQQRVDMHMQLMMNHKDLYLGNSRPLVELYHRLTGSWLYGLVKRAGGTRLLGALLGRR